MTEDKDKKPKAKDPSDNAGEISLSTDGNLAFGIGGGLTIDTDGGLGIAVGPISLDLDGSKD